MRSGKSLPVDRGSPTTGLGIVFRHRWDLRKRLLTWVFGFRRVRSLPMVLDGLATNRGLRALHNRVWRGSFDLVWHRIPHRGQSPCQSHR